MRGCVVLSRQLELNHDREEAVHDVTSEHVIPAYKASSIISLNFALF